MMALEIRDRIGGMTNIERAHIQLPDRPTKEWNRDELVLGIASQRARRDLINAGQTGDLEAAIAAGLKRLTSVGYRDPASRLGDELRGPEAIFSIQTWTDLLKDFYISAGPEAIQRAFRDYSRMDADPYRDTPKPGQIISILREYGINPEAEVAKRKLEKQIRDETEAYKAEVAKVMTDEKREQLRGCSFFRDFPGAVNLDDERRANE